MGTYTSVPDHLWEPLARLVLDATYEATLLCAANLAMKGQVTTHPRLLAAAASFGHTEERRRCPRRVEHT